MTDYLRGCVIIRIIDADAICSKCNWHDDEHSCDGCSLHSAPTIDVSEISDGYHTFADLYEQRLILSAALAKSNPFAWKSKLHSDGTEPFGGGWFVMGWKTENGQYTYHYELKDWDLFYCKEIQKAPEWDGHTSNDVRRLLTLPSVDAVPVVRCKDCKWFYESDTVICCEKHTGLALARKDDYCSYGERRKDD